MRSDLVRAVLRDLASEIRVARKDLRHAPFATSEPIREWLEYEGRLVRQFKILWPIRHRAQLNEFGWPIALEGK